MEVCEESCHIFPLLGQNLSGSLVDESKLLQAEGFDQRAVGMENFRTRGKRLAMSKSSVGLSEMNKANVARARWQNAAMKIKLIKDPWAEFKIETYPVERVVRHRYNPIAKKWKRDECVVKMEQKQFANGAMRACFRLKKLSNFAHEKSWEHASNYVAKCYMSSEMGRERYFDDVKLQMDAKLWAEIYNRHNPPKKIDIFQVSILEFKNRAGSPLYHLEHYIEGKYIKYNSNAGFVEDLHCRYTPHAFSHFTFEVSNHELIVVDIQGVGDLYTDPQIHTASGTDYGDGNLGVKGFALFFYSHVCNDICRGMGLTPFDLAPSEAKSMQKIKSVFQNSAMTRSRGKEEPVNCHYSCSARTRYLLSRLSNSDENSNDLIEVDESEGYNSATSSPGFHQHGVNHYLKNQSSSSINFPCLMSDHSNDTSVVESPFDGDDAFRYFNANMFNRPRPSAVLAEKDILLNADTEFNRRSVQLYGSFESILGKVHLELCKYHENGRFTTHEKDECDLEAAFYHLEQAANLGELEALVNVAKIYMQLPHDILPDYQVDDTDSNYDIGFDHLIEAAEKGEKYSLYYVAKAFDTGIGLSKHKSIDWTKALDYYRKIISESNHEKNEDCGYSDINSDMGEPVYVILARIGEMYLQGINGIEQNLQEAADLFSEAADKAMQFGKGRLANKYYNLSEKAMSML